MQENFFASKASSDMLTVYLGEYKNYLINVSLKEQMSSKNMKTFIQNYSIPLFMEFKLSEDHLATKLSKMTVISFIKNEKQLNYISSYIRNLIFSFPNLTNQYQFGYIYYSRNKHQNLFNILNEDLPVLLVYNQQTKRFIKYSGDFKRIVKGVEFDKKEDIVFWLKSVRFNDHPFSHLGFFYFLIFLIFIVLIIQKILIYFPYYFCSKDPKLLA